MGTSGLSGVARILLVVVNILFLLIGVALTIFGFILRFGKSLYEKALNEGLDSLENALRDSDWGNLYPKDMDLAEIVEGLIIGLIVGGIILIAITVLACCGACCKVDCMLWLYAIITIVCLIGELIVIALLYGKPAIYFHIAMVCLIAKLAFVALLNGKPAIGWDDTFVDILVDNHAFAIPVLAICGIIQIAFILFAISIIRSNRQRIDPIID